MNTRQWVFPIHHSCNRRVNLSPDPSSWFIIDQIGKVPACKHPGPGNAPLFEGQSGSFLARLPLSSNALVH
ncbi:MAG: hypothetical protein JXA44_13175 [Methanospirillaceae archaeon]|nr:hypothetical protein [Methanospirillaceae archaeon]